LRAPRKSETGDTLNAAIAAAFRPNRRRETLIDPEVEIFSIGMGDWSEVRLGMGRMVR
jgi:hypothetical protein